MDKIGITILRGIGYFFLGIFKFVFISILIILSIVSIPIDYLTNLGQDEEILKQLDNENTKTLEDEL
jgi:hypothetical protein